MKKIVLYGKPRPSSGRLLKTKGLFKSQLSALKEAWQKALKEQKLLLVVKPKYVDFDIVRCAERVTIVGLYNKSSKILNIGIAICSHNDQFEKKKGRLLAEARAQSAMILETGLKDEKEAFAHLTKLLISVESDVEKYKADIHNFKLNANKAS